MRKIIEVTYRMESSLGILCDVKIEYSNWFRHYKVVQTFHLPKYKYQNTRIFKECPILCATGELYDGAFGKSLADLMIYEYERNEKLTNNKNDK